MDELYRSYLSFLRSMSRGLESLTGLNEKKLTAAQQEDLMGLNDLLNQEQAQALNFRGLELTRDKLLPQLGLEGVPLEQVPCHFPPAMQEEARQAARPGGCWSRTSTRWRASLCRWAALPPAGRGDPATARSRKAAPRLRP